LTTTWITTLIETLRRMTTFSDFTVYWKIGRGALAGQSPYYDVAQSWYPPAVSYAFALFGLFPLEVAVWVWRAILLAALVLTMRRYGKWIAFFAPLPFVIVAGQVDLLLVLALGLLDRRGWKAAIGATLFTLKPILGAVVLPWYLWRWLRGDRVTLARFLGLSLAVHLWPLLIRPTVWREWFEIIFLHGGTANYFGGVGLWVFASTVPMSLLLLGSLALGAAGVWLGNARTSRALLLLASPFSLPYHASVLTGTAPDIVLAVASLAGLIGFVASGSDTWFILMPLAALVGSLGLRRVGIVAGKAVLAGETVKA
jgi:hypothetical protein